jgi:methionyl-tRNA synthetase
MIHFIGKDNIVFHCIIFPTMLKTEGSYILPDNVPANEFLNLEGDKISTSRNWAVWLHEYLEDFPGRQDVLRYVLTANMPETKDNDFTWKDFQARNNNELVAILGNFVNRALVLTNKYFDGAVPPRGELSAYDREVLEQIPLMRRRTEHSLDHFRFREALKEAMALARLGNKYLADTEPWALIKIDKEKVGTILNICLQITANLTLLLEPFLPFSMKKLREMILFDKTDWNLIGRDNLLPEGHTLGKVQHLFRKIEDAEIDKQIARLQETKAANEEDAQSDLPPLKEEIVYDDFTKMDIRTATILEAEKVPKTKKLLKLTLDTGIDRRIVVSGIAEYFSPEEIIGKQIAVLVNLAPRKIKGIESQGMILMAEDPDGRLHFIIPEDGSANGSQIK